MNITQLTSHALLAISVGEWVAVVGLALTVFGGVFGGVWWMASMYAQLLRLVEAVQELKAEMHHSTEALWGLVREHERRLDHLEQRHAAAFRET